MRHPEWEAAMKPRALTARSLRSIGKLRGSTAIDDELDWFFNRAECDMGNQSNYLAMLGPYGPGSAIPSPEDAAEASHRARRIRRWLTSITSPDAGVLQCAYELRNWPVVLWDRLGRLTGIVVRLACALDGLPEDRDLQRVIETARAEWLAAQAPHTAVDATWNRLRREAEARFARAHHAYCAVRGHAGRSS
jgi:hypothetical protein